MIIDGSSYKGKVPTDYLLGTWWNHGIAKANAQISAVKAGLKLSISDFEAHILARGNVTSVVNALIAADKAKIALPFQQAAAIDLAGRDVFEAVQVSVNPKVIATPAVSAVALDGVQLLATARVPVRANINRLVGGAGEDTILAVSERELLAL